MYCTSPEFPICLFYPSQPKISDDNPTNSHLLFVRVAVMLLHILDVVIEVAPVVARAELVVALHVQELVRLF